jgi:endonuclease-3 related protein
MVGAILTQNTSWANVERAMRNLRGAGMLSLEAIFQADSAYLQTLLRPAGYFRQKTRRLQDVTAFILASYGTGDRASREAGDGLGTAKNLQRCLPDGLVSSGIEKTSAEGEHPALARMLAEPTEKLRGILLEQKGIGPETADSILLYAGNRAVFVVDAYTRRIFARHQLPANDHETIRLLVEHALRELPPEDHGGSQPAPDRPEIHQPSAISAAYRSELAQRYNEFHALLVQIGKHYCLKKAPKCTNCPLSCFLPVSDNAQAQDTPASQK